RARLVKFHWKPLLGVHSLVWDEAQKLAGKDPDFLRRDLWESIERGDYPEWEFAIQTIEEADELNFDFDPLDPTKLWPEQAVPVRRIGKLTLNRNPDNFFAETEQVAFHPGHIVPGIDFSNDPLLQGRLFSYLDTQLTRLGGPNFAELPINRSVAPVQNNQRDGIMRHAINRGQVSYGPNSLGGGCPMQAPQNMRGFVSYAERVDAQKVRERSESFGDHFSQAALFWNSQSDPEQEHIVLAFRFELGKVEHKAIRQHVVDLLTNVDEELATRVAKGIGVPAPANGQAASAANDRLEAGWEQFGVTSRPTHRSPGEITRAPELSMANTVKDTVKSRCIAVLAADGFDGAQVTAITKALEAAGARAEIVSTQLGAIRSADGQALEPDKTLLTAGSIMYDAVFVPGGSQSVAALIQEGDAIHFVNEAFRHGKAIAATGGGVDLLLASQAAGNGSNGRKSKKALSLPGVVAEREPSDLSDVAQQFVEAIAQHRSFTRQHKERVPA
ncbi:MAG: catalase, partial [Chloroflexi bacterium]|nr:catalase [Chloroflexota bacterium]